MHNLKKFAQFRLKNPATFLLGLHKDHCNAQTCFSTLSIVLSSTLQRPCLALSPASCNSVAPKPYDSYIQSSLRSVAIPRLNTSP